MSKISVFLLIMLCLLQAPHDKGGNSPWHIESETLKLLRKGKFALLAQLVACLPEGFKPHLSIHSKFFMRYSSMSFFAFVSISNIFKIPNICTTWYSVVTDVCKKLSESGVESADYFTLIHYDTSKLCLKSSRLMLQKKCSEPKLQVFPHQSKPR